MLSSEKRGCFASRTGRKTLKTIALSSICQVVSILTLLALTVGGVTLAEEHAIKYFVQLVRGTDSDKPPPQGGKRVGAKLEKIFRCSLKWTNYWELCRHEVLVPPGRAAKVRLSKEREVEVGLTATGKRMVRSFRNGKLTQQTVGPIGESMTLIGEVNDPRSVWFIVVRRDEPGS
jgi:hypothetical protein